MAEAKRKRDTPARRRIREGLRALGYEVRDIEWNGAWMAVDFGSDGGFSIDGFGSFWSADDVLQWCSDPRNLDTLRRHRADEDRYREYYGSPAPAGDDAREGAHG